MQPFAVPLGEVPFNHEILREAYALCHCLPVLSTDKFKTDFYDVSIKPRIRRVGLMPPFLHAGHWSQSPWETGSLFPCSNAMTWDSWPT